MSAGYDGKTIIWDIWEGKPVQIYETDHYKLVDGKFSPVGMYYAKMKFCHLTSYHRLQMNLSLFVCRDVLTCC